jgi:hypothetical protein
MYACKRGYACISPFDHSALRTVIDAAHNSRVNTSDESARASSLWPWLNPNICSAVDTVHAFLLLHTGHVGGLYHYSHTHYARPPTREWWDWL